MQALCKILLAATLSWLVAGCDQNGRPIEQPGLDRLAKGISTEGEVRVVMGQPEVVLEEESGERLLQYPQGPEGARTWLFKISSDGKLVDYKQLLTQENFAAIQPGMSRDDVRWLLGKPRTVVPFPLKNEEVWDWRYRDINPDQRFFNVHFDRDSGRVTRTSSSDARTIN
ncbi:MAG: outer membrane protein assembly factor BamE [Pseudomonadota bacterium]|nr:outer membrane protein assembly factor BamE [Pseudomonadota bacterium]